MKEHELTAKWREEDETEINRAFEALLSTPRGRKFLTWLLQLSRFGTQPFASNSLHTAFQCGELNVGQQIFERLVQVSPDGYVTMMKEQTDERSTRTAARARADDVERAADPYAD